MHRLELIEDAAVTQHPHRLIPSSLTKEQKMEKKASKGKQAKSTKKMEKAAKKEDKGMEKGTK